MTGATVIWWVAMAAHAPWFLHGAASGTSGSAFDPRLAVTVTTMAVAVIVAAHGTIRATRGALRLRRG
jgi:hypothetical protein